MLKKQRDAGRRGTVARAAQSQDGQLIKGQTGSSRRATHREEGGSGAHNDASSRRHRLPALAHLPRSAALPVRKRLTRSSVSPACTGSTRSFHSPMRTDLAPNLLGLHSAICTEMLAAACTLTCSYANCAHRTTCVSDFSLPRTACARALTPADFISEHAPHLRARRVACVAEFGERRMDCDTLSRLCRLRRRRQQSLRNDHSSVGTSEKGGTLVRR
eukprot:6176150-Pleurochrysis_carterae.AAC.3